ncbi:MAG: hypothetical protein ACPG5W_12720, partial [Flavobacteriales bacterium]
APLHKLATPRAGMITGDNKTFLRFWYEVGRSRIGFGFDNRTDAKSSQQKWFPYQKGGAYRKWFGNKEYVVDWQNDGYRLRTTQDSKGKIPAHAFNEKYIFRPNVNWSAVTSSYFSARVTEQGALFDAGGSAAFPKTYEEVLLLAGLLNSYVTRQLLRAVNPTLNYQAWNIGNLPVPDALLNDQDSSIITVRSLVQFAKTDWNASELSWEFTISPLLSDVQEHKLDDHYSFLRREWNSEMHEIRRLEEQINIRFAAAYGISDVSLNVPLREVTINSNPHYRYSSLDGGEISSVDVGKRSLPLLRCIEQWKDVNYGRELRLLEDTMREFVSYAVGCMFGRYSLDKPGLILANAGETVADFLRKVRMKAEGGRMNEE